ncbi:hypothetical protein GQ44DRAFT_736009 [Phaeosphaeriaceae sp. PMI808]|nr:hypothetical protein GQ44DRAFT_736009 [Phaeosphaeriaceae sp. PMI808]
MPSPERNRYSNKESSKVNAGLCNRGQEDASEWPADIPFYMNRCSVKRSFGQSITTGLLLKVSPSVEIIAYRLLHPPSHAFVHNTLSIQWVVGAAGFAHMKFREIDERYVLAQDSDLCRQGRALGIPALYMEWLCGTGDDASAAEQAVSLTPDFFEEIC